MVSSSSVESHLLSVVTWDVPYYVELGTKFRIKVGAKCFPGECRLAGDKVEVYDHAGEKVATGLLGGELWPGTTRYWTEVELQAPSVEGRYEWRVKFLAEAPHEEASWTFYFIATRPVEHIVTVKVVYGDGKIPIKGVVVMSGPLYSAYTDDDGVAKIKLPKGKHVLVVSSVTPDHPFKASSKSIEIEVNEDMTVDIELPFVEFHEDI